MKPKIMNSHKFNKDYFENGLKMGISCYENFHWMPERSFKEAHWFIEHMKVYDSARILDYGCAKGFFVKAMRILGYDAWGYDISKYAISEADNDTSAYLRDTPFCRSIHFDFGFCKDVLEHSDNKAKLKATLIEMREYSTRWLIVVPLAANGQYIEKEYEKDSTHFMRFSAIQWSDIIENAGMKIESVSPVMRGLKDKWAYNRKSNLFIRARA